MVLSKVSSSFQTYSVINQRDIDIFVLSPLCNALGLSTLYAFAQLLAMQHMFCQNKVFCFASSWAT